MRRVELILRYFFWKLTLPEVCEFSRLLWDIHDYHVSTGGDGHASHMHRYTCSNCGTKFEI